MSLISHAGHRSPLAYEPVIGDVVGAMYQGIGSRNGDDPFLSPNCYYTQKEIWGVCGGLYLLGVAQTGLRMVGRDGHGLAGTHPDARRRHALACLWRIERRTPEGLGYLLEGLRAKSAHREPGASTCAYGSAPVEANVSV